MRIDKFLWSVRYYKTRSLANAEVKKGKVSLGGRPVKSAYDVMVGDVFKIRKNQIDYKIKVIQLPKSRVGAKLVSLYITDLTDPEQLEALASRRMVQDYYREKGEGRPTKKDRRDLDDFITPYDDENEEEEENVDWDDFFNGEEKEY